ncbi:uncharacterized protein LOC109846070 [Asparagus officinalis]|uniref:uncharacterized protein LOC109846070 n=1 Tax=Asparagus officinalis TaxID=4686 RepID=UPI00098DF5C7|nr:uncharacterized protein LOC109846070 [Asparagus officinalis]
MAETTKFHPALAVNNIKNFIPVTLDMESSQYNYWATLFKIHVRAYQVLDHIIPPTSTATGKKTSSSKDAKTEDKDLWDYLDVIVLQWIYGTITNDVLLTILEQDATAMDAWNRLVNLFHDNKTSRAVHLEYQLSQVRLDDFPYVVAYCQRIKTLADQLGNVGVPVLDARRVLVLCSGLNSTYRGVGRLIQHSKPLKSFSDARSTLVMEEDTLNNSAAREYDSALIVGTHTNSSNDTSNTVHPPRHNNNHHRNNHHKKNGGRGRGNHNGHDYKGHGGGHGNTHGGRGSAPQQQHQSSP